MAKSTGKQEFVHWLELSESLGVDVTREIEFYFDGDADLGSSPPVADGIETEVSSTARQLALEASKATVGRPAASSIDLVQPKTDSGESTGRPEKKLSSSTKAAQRTVSKDNNEEKRTESKDSPPNVLGLDWSAPTPTGSESRSTRPETETKGNAGREKPPEKKTVVAQRKPAPPRPESDKPASDDVLGWGQGSTESDVANSDDRESTRSPIAEKKPENRPVKRVENPKSTPISLPPESQESSPPAVESLESSFFGSGLVEPPVAPPARERSQPRPPAREVSRKPVQESRANKTAQVDPLGFFDSPAESPKRDGTADNESDFDPLDDNGAEEVEEKVLESGWDEDFVEFEIEDLDPNASRQPRNRNRDTRDSRPPRKEKPARREVPAVVDKMDDADSGFSDPDEEFSEPVESHSSEPEQEDATRSGTRSSRRRKPRGRRKQGENQPGERTGTTRPPESAHEAKKPESRPKPRPVDNDGDDFDDDDDDDDDGFETTGTRDESRSSKARNLPTWNETVDVIVQSNIASRKKQPPRRRRGSGGQGGPSRQR